MASIRRTLSPVPRPGIALSGEASSVASPLSRSSTCAPQSHPPSSGFFSSLSSSLDSQAFAFIVFSPRTSRPLEKSKLKGQVWRRMLFQFFICFLVGIFIGFTPFSSINISTNLMSKNQAFSFEVMSAVGKFQSYDTVSRSDMALDIGAMKENGTLKPELVESKPIDGISQHTNYNVSLVEESELDFRKLLIIVTPTHVWPFQAYHLNRLAQTIKLVSSPLLWIVVEMASQSVETADILRRTGVTYRHLVCNVNLTDVKDRSVHQRNVALSHIETHHLDGIVYFADDDNIYSTELFEQMRQIRRFGTWVVANVPENKINPILEGPICNGTQVIGWHMNEAKWRFRRFHAEISGFAFNSTILWDPKRWHRPMLEPIRQRHTVKDGLQVSTFIEQIVEDESQMEGLEQDCSRIMVWHLHLESANSVYPHEWFMKENLDAIASFTRSS
ncbi:probable beta-1,4-xylosyltransferase IRX9H [Cannabis sativa]|uniref:Glycosyltransferases n=1 Tax=Cannabis sativa TaxID=3483 RepID=A0A7J6ERP5_CANSA|nr:probable beta-1,4-xylosyltransferase IRX9H [Cannabis sativa]XP_030482518.1 probable beta-1,4-xylosyltransferase IRX9H [Cannabis sativa]XP_030482526.1 probable beta-1,4-xylosyltransferase IRX9H [Cannabis sativa]XP_030482534.1 probable beta-1,4-xylosyltransferase IRX9H [Cannabis sativa]XP_060961184.1 probable beta-1,4-xylosyltransferase IRX9H [Cannabis sativa]XP_060961185.1 probable beta-1,4-xylosyltransferase IRX9H [Cannabis sativa]XP_060961186.1 probable beta-1,4-xylosyltransferase IRX9H [